MSAPLNDENTSQVLAGQRVQAAATRQVAVEVLAAAATACLVAAGTVSALMVQVWLFQPGHDFPGRFWFAVLPLLGAAFTFKVYASGIGSPRRETRASSSPQGDPQSLAFIDRRG